MRFDVRREHGCTTELVAIETDGNESTLNVAGIISQRDWDDVLPHLVKWLNSLDLRNRVEWTK